VTSTHTLTLDGVGPVDVTLTESGSGQPFLLLHGGGGPATVNAFGELLAAEKGVRVITPVHPGFAGTPRPDALNSVRGLAALYVALLNELDLTGVTVLGNSIGGWIAAEIALLDSPRVDAAILIDAVGIEVPGHPVADFFSLTMDQVSQLSYHDPVKFGIDPAKLPPAALAAMPGNRASLATYAGSAMVDRTLAGRLAKVMMPTLVLWGDADRIGDPDYGRAFAAAIPGAEFRLLAEAGHLPQIETPGQVLDAVWGFAGDHPGLGAGTRPPRIGPVLGFQHRV
jgi:pimeloyl-ACP methyl ester carboxylesterase